ncbi:hypothetical protein K737_300712 [Holospora undulata HU1]|uniref:Uncharacterized protein n=1 Tax=Holospora undulata HU1 TaxID=1321371 RepID=A0A061JII6_9PROT|nr:hypothetical protein K737_300712 [Holospora undulata HU1]
MCGRKKLKNFEYSTGINSLLLHNCQMPYLNGMQHLDNFAHFELIDIPLVHFGNYFYILAVRILGENKVNQ